MSVGRADANGAGSVSPPVSAPTTTDSATDAKGMPKAGLANGASTTWSIAPKSVQVAEAPKRSGSLDEAVEDVQFAKLRFVHANNNYVGNQTDETRAVYKREKGRYRQAQIGLGEVIDKQANKRASDSSLYPRGHGLKNSAQVRKLEQKILDHTTSPLLKDALKQAISENRSLRAPRELKALSAKMQEGKLNPTQKNEAAHIIGDATDAVIGTHWEDEDQASDKVTKHWLDRLDKLLNTATTGNAQKFDPALYDELTANIKSQMGSLDPATNKEFNDIVAKYSDRLEPETNIGP